MYSEAELTDHLVSLGVSAGEVLLVQASTRAIGPVAGGSATVVAALRAALGPAGTLVAYTATPENSETSPLHLAAIGPLDEAQRRAFRATMPPYDRAGSAASPTMGRLAEEVRTTPGAVRSAHPQTSFSALGPRAEWLTEIHDLDCHLGDRSPVRRLYEADARVLLIRVPWSCCTVFHLAEYWQPQPPLQHYGCVVTGPSGAREWVRFDAPKVTTAHFEQVAELMLAKPGLLVEGRLGDAHCFLLPVRAAVNFADKWLRKHRRWSPDGGTPYSISQADLPTLEALAVDG